MVDLREKVEGDRGILKKIQTHIPGFAGYRRKEDIRAADSLLRIQLADKIVNVRKQLEDCRSVLTDNYDTQNLDKLGTIIMKFKSVEGEVRHAEQGYSGISSTLQVKERQLDLLYEYDYQMITNILNIEKLVPQLRGLIGGSDPNAAKTQMENIKLNIDAFETIFKKRMEAITGTEVV
jgi:hypothetical protein